MAYPINSTQRDRCLISSETCSPPYTKPRLEWRRSPRLHIFVAATFPATYVDYTSDNAAYTNRQAPRAHVSYHIYSTILLSDLSESVDNSGRRYIPPSRPLTLE